MTVKLITSKPDAEIAADLKARMHVAALPMIEVIADAKRNVFTIHFHIDDIGNNVALTVIEVIKKF